MIHVLISPYRTIAARRLTRMGRKAHLSEQEEGPERGPMVDRTPLGENLLPLLDLRHLKLEHKRLYPCIFELYVTAPIEYVDAYHAALLEHFNQHELYSFDRDFDAIPGLTRLEPAGDIGLRDRVHGAHRHAKGPLMCPLCLRAPI